MVYKKSLALPASQLHKQALGLASLKVPAWSRADPPSPLPSLHTCAVSAAKMKRGGVSWECRCPWGGVPSATSCHLPFLSVIRSGDTNRKPPRAWRGRQGGSGKWGPAHDAPWAPEDLQWVSDLLPCFKDGNTVFLIFCCILEYRKSKEILKLFYSYPIK